MPSSTHRTIDRMSLEQLALTEVAKTLTLPDNDKIRILAITAVEEGAAVTAASTLFDTLR